VDVPNVFDIQSSIMLVVALALLAVKIFALVTSLMFTPEHYRAADKMTKQTWVAILGIAVGVNLLLPGVMILNLALTIAALVFLVDVRPALSSLTRR
jgi:hypothetical protein